MILPPHRDCRLIMTPADLCFGAGLNESNNLDKSRSRRKQRSPSGPTPRSWSEVNSARRPPSSMHRGKPSENMARLRSSRRNRLLCIIREHYPPSSATTPPPYQETLSMTFTPSNGEGNKCNQMLCSDANRSKHRKAGGAFGGHYS